MKKISFVLLVSICSLQELFAFINPTNLKIQLIGYNANDHKNYAVIIIPNLNRPFNEQLKITEDGVIYTTLLLSQPQEIILSYDGASVPLLAIPEDNIELGLGIKELNNSNTPLSYTIKCKNQITNTLILNNLRLINGWISKSTNAFKADKAIDLMAYRALREQELDNQLADLRELTKKEKISDEHFLDWSQSRMKYAAGLDFCLFPFMGRTNRSVTENDEYFDFINTYNTDNKLVTTTQAYAEYLKTLITSLEIIGNISDKYQERRDIMNKNSASLFPLKFEIITKTIGESQRKLALEYIFLTSKNIPRPYLDSLANYLPLETLNVVKESSKTKNTSIVHLLNEYDLKKEEKEELLNLYNSLEGKLVFHDFWFLGCAPCMIELPNYNKLIEASGDSVQFIFYGVYMDQDKWQDALDKYQLKGKNILLSKNQLAFFEKYFNLKGFPHHQIINKKGMIIDEYLPRVDPTNFQTIIKTFENLNNSK